MEYLGTELISGILHSSINMTKHNICFFIGLIDEHCFQIIIGEQRKNGNDAQKDNA